MASANKRMRQWLKHVERANPGMRFEVGAMWSEPQGWRVYQRIGDKGLSMSARDARGMVATFERVGTDPQWREAYEGMKELFAEMTVIADECDAKNAAGVIPEGYVAVAPAQGSA